MHAYKCTTYVGNDFKIYIQSECYVILHNIFLIIKERLMRIKKIKNVSLFFLRDIRLLQIFKTIQSYNYKINFILKCELLYFFR